MQSASGVEASFPPSADSVGKKIDYLSRVLLPAGRVDDYLHLMEQVLDSDIEYIDPVHTLHGKSAVLKMLARYVPRAANDQFVFELLQDDSKSAIWTWTIRLKIFFLPFKINGLVHAKIRDGKIIYQREFYDPMESIEVIPLFGKFYKWILKIA